MNTKEFKDLLSDYNIQIIVDGMNGVYGTGTPLKDFVTFWDKGCFKLKDEVKIGSDTITYKNETDSKKYNLEIKISDSIDLSEYFENFELKVLHNMLNNGTEQGKSIGLNLKNNFEYLPKLKKERDAYIHMINYYKDVKEFLQKFSPSPYLSVDKNKIKGFCPLIRQFFKDDFVTVESLPIMNCLKPIYSKHTGLWFELGDINNRLEFLDFCVKTYDFMNRSGCYSDNTRNRLTKVCSLHIKVFLDFKESFERVTEILDSYIFNSLNPSETSVNLEELTK